MSCAYFSKLRRGRWLSIRWGKLKAYWIGVSMVGTPSCALMLPSTYCTIECTTDWGCTSTCMRSAGTSKSQRASMTSNPLFINEAESIVTLRPMLQLGCLRASASVTLSSCSRFHPRKGPPEAVSSILSTPPTSPTRLWKMAECSESTGSIGTWLRAAASVTICPATTMVSLLARAMGL